MDKIMKMLSHKSTWTGIAAIATGSLPLFGVPPKIVAGIASVVGGLAIIFLRAGIEKSGPSN